MIALRQARLLVLALCAPVFGAPIAVLLGGPAGATTPLGDTGFGAPREQGGRLEVVIDGVPVALPALSTAMEVDIQGEIARVRVIQVFENPGQRPMNATYLFPLPEDAAVNAMTLQVGDERVRAEIKEKAEAKRVYTQAQAAGKAAALLTQHRPNMFTQEVANVMPGLPVTVTLDYVQTVRLRDGAHRLALPLVVGPRYQPAPRAEVAQHDETPQPGQGPASASWELNDMPAYPPVMGLDLPDEIASERVSISIRLSGGVPLGSIWSDSHAVEVRRDPAEDGVTHGAEIMLATGPVIDNRDFLLAYRLGGAETAVGLLAHPAETGEDGHFTLLLTPPAAPEADALVPRELVFVLDTSGSMAGMPMEASKAFMMAALDTLRPDDTFRILRFA
ncbi:MAG: VIT domain-containing protein, partial [Pseudomonadota bacterium]